MRRIAELQSAKRSGTSFRSRAINGVVSATTPTTAASGTRYRIRFRTSSRMVSATRARPSEDLVNERASASICATALAHHHIRSRRSVAPRARATVTGSVNRRMAPKKSGELPSVPFTRPGTW